MLPVRVSVNGPAAVLALSGLRAIAHSPLEVVVAVYGEPGKPALPVRETFSPGDAVPCNVVGGAGSRSVEVCRILWQREGVGPLSASGSVRLGDSAKGRFVHIVAEEGVRGDRRLAAVDGRGEQEQGGCEVRHGYGPFSVWFFARRDGEDGRQLQLQCLS